MYDPRSAAATYPIMYKFWCLQHDKAYIVHHCLIKPHLLLFQAESVFLFHTWSVCHLFLPKDSATVVLFLHPQHAFRSLCKPVQTSLKKPWRPLHWQAPLFPCHPCHHKLRSEVSLHVPQNILLITDCPDWSSFLSQRLYHMQYKISSTFSPCFSLQLFFLLYYSPTIHTI